MNLSKYQPGKRSEKMISTDQWQIFNEEEQAVTAGRFDYLTRVSSPPTRDSAHFENLRTG